MDHVIYDGTLMSVCGETRKQINRAIDFGGAAFFATSDGRAVRLLGAIGRTRTQIVVKRTRCSPWEPLPVGVFVQWIFPAMGRALDDEDARRLRGLLPHLTGRDSIPAEGAHHAFE